MVWQGRWIWPGEAPSTPGPDAHSLAWLRREFDLAEVPVGVPARVTAHSRFVLYLNGVEVARGPARSAPERIAYETLDLAPHLVPGRNVLGAEVRYYAMPMPWWRPASAVGELGRGGFAFEAPALGVVSDASWRGALGRLRLGAASANAHAPRPEIHDSESCPSAGWLAAGFDDSGWLPAAVLNGLPIAPDPAAIPGSPYTAPEPSGIGPLTALPVQIGDRLTIGTIWVEAEGPAGSTVTVTAGEDLRAGGTVEAAPRYYQFRCELTGAGVERFEPRDPVGFRYVSAAAEGGARVLRLGAVERRHPTTGEAAFDCDDERLRAIWRAGARTVEVCSTDSFIDCPGREQNAWVGDAYVHALVTLVTNSDWRLVRRHLRLGAQAPRPDGFLPMIATHEPTRLLVCTDYSLHWVRTLARYYERSADVATVRELFPVALRVLDAFERFREADGLLHGVPGVFVDWAMVDRGEVTGAVDGIYAAALTDTAALARQAFGSESLAAELEGRAELTRAGFELLWDAGRGLYVDGLSSRRVSQHTNAAAFVGGCVAAARQAALLAAILDEDRLRITPHPATLPVAQHWASLRMKPSDLMDFDDEVHIVRAQPFFTHFVHQAAALAGRQDLLADLCLRWYPQVETGHGTLHEFWSAEPGQASRAHGWAATATYDLTTHVLGVRPLEPGCGRLEIKPVFGRLERLAGTVPTPQGEARIELTREGGRITVPQGMSAVFEERELGAGTHRV